ncbi:MAG: hypothetical protein KY391_01450 [Actinobacteria bacterium]|nr:hypothetical protein [Actinomycetota bacterium]
MKLIKRALKVAIVSSVFIATVPFGGVAAEAGSNCFTHKTEEKGFFNKLNIERKLGGRVQLRLDRELSKVARKHTREMTDKNLLHHTSDGQMRSRVTNWQLLGENVGVGGTVESLHVAFMNSPGHKANVMHRSFRHVGIGTRYAHGRLWVTVVFEAETNPGTTLRMPSC